MKLFHHLPRHNFFTVTQKQFHSLVSFFLSLVASDIFSSLIDLSWFHYPVSSSLFQFSPSFRGAVLLKNFLSSHHSWTSITFHFFYCMVFLTLYIATEWDSGCITSAIGKCVSTIEKWGEKNYIKKGMKKDNVVEYVMRLQDNDLVEKWWFCNWRR